MVPVNISTIQKEIFSDTVSVPTYVFAPNTTLKQVFDKWVREIRNLRYTEYWL